MHPKYLFDWRCASVGLPDIDAQRQGIVTRLRYGNWRDWESETNDGSPNPSYRLVIDDDTGRIIGGTLYGPDASSYVNELKALISKNVCDDELGQYRSSDFV